MLNKKKLEMTFKKYKKNWIEEIESKDSEEEYEEIKNEIDDIIKNECCRERSCFIDRFK